MRLATDTEIVAADVAIEVVIKGTLLPIFKEDADEAGSAHQYRRHFFYNGALTPLFIAKMDDFVSESKV